MLVKHHFCHVPNNCAFNLSANWWVTLTSGLFSFCVRCSILFSSTFCVPRQKGSTPEVTLTFTGIDFNFTGSGFEFYSRWSDSTHRHRWVRRRRFRNWERKRCPRSRVCRQPGKLKKLGCFTNDYQKNACLQNGLSFFTLSVPSVPGSPRWWWWRDFHLTEKKIGLKFV